MKTRFYVNWHYGESRHARIARSKAVNERLKRGGIAYEFTYSNFGGGTYEIEGEIPKNIKRLVTEIEIHT